MLDFSIEKTVIILPFLESHSLESIYIDYETSSGLIKNNQDELTIESCFTHTVIYSYKALTVVRVETLVIVRPVVRFLSPLLRNHYSGK